MNLGRKMKSPGEIPASPVNEKEPKVVYPSLNLGDEIADNFLKACPCDLGDELTATVKLKVTSLRKDEYGNSVGFDVLSLDDISETPDADEDYSEEKVLGYKRPKMNKETPSVSAEDLQD